MVLVGRIARPHGIRGHVIVTPDTDFVEQRFAEGSTLWTRPAGASVEEPLRVTSMRVHNGRPVIGLEGYSRIEDAERLSGLELRVPEATLQPLPSGSYYQHQLVGCEVETAAGIRVGTVKRVEGGAAGSLLTVDGPGGEVLIPMVAPICVGIDVDGKRIRIDPPEGLLELNVK
jgi:16S rRNA processing protein RimM